MWPNAQLWVIAPTGSALIWFNVFYDLLLGLWGLIGATWVVLAWRRYGRAAAATEREPGTPAAYA